MKRSIVLFLVVVFAICLVSCSQSTPEEAQLIGSWDSEHMYVNDELVTGNSSVSALFNADKSGVLTVGEETFDITWEYRKTDSDAIGYTGYFESGEPFYMQISTEPSSAVLNF